MYYRPYTKKTLAANLLFAGLCLTSIAPFLLLFLIDSAELWLKNNPALSAFFGVYFAFFLVFMNFAAIPGVHHKFSFERMLKAHSEKAKFKKEFGFDISRTSKNTLLPIIGGVTLVALVIIGLFKELPAPYVLGGFLVLGGLYALGSSYWSKKAYKEAVNCINQKISNTDWEKNIYKSKKFVECTRFEKNESGKMIEIYELIMETPIPKLKDHHFLIKERNVNCNKFKGETSDEIFENRFDLSDGLQLSKNFKEICLQEIPYLNFEINQHGICFFLERRKKSRPWSGLHLVNSSLEAKLRLYELMLQIGDEV